MEWFKYFPKNFDLSSSEPKYIHPPLRHSIQIYEIYEEIKKDQIISIKVPNSDFIKITSQNATIDTDNTQFLVVYLDNEKEEEYTVVRSSVIDGYLYFQAARDHEIEKDIIDKYYLYYGNKYLKYLQSVTYNSKPAYKQISTQDASELSGNPSLLNTTAFNLSTETIQNNYYTTVKANENGEDKEKFSYYNQDTDWLNYKTSTIGAKVSGYFNGPALKINAYKTPSSGKVNLKIIKLEQSYKSFNLLEKKEQTISEEEEEVYTAIDENAIDLYSPSVNEATIYQTTSLENKKYYFFIEVIESKNIASTKNELELISFEYNKNFNCVLQQKEYNSELSFKV